MGQATRRRYSPKLKFQVVLEALTETRSPARIAKAYGVHAVDWPPVRLLTPQPSGL